MNTRSLATLGLPLALAACGGATTPSPAPASPTPSAPADLAVAAPSGGEDGPAPSSTWIGVAGESAAFLPGTHETFLGVWVDVPEVWKQNG